MEGMEQQYIVRYINTENYTIVDRDEAFIIKESIKLGEKFALIVDNESWPEKIINLSHVACIVKMKNNE